MKYTGERTNASFTFSSNIAPAYGSTGAVLRTTGVLEPEPAVPARSFGDPLGRVLLEPIPGGAILLPDHRRAVRAAAARDPVGSDPAYRGRRGVPVLLAEERADGGDLRAELRLCRRHPVVPVFRLAGGLSNGETALPRCRRQDGRRPLRHPAAAEVDDPPPGPRGVRPVGGRRLRHPQDVQVDHDDPDRGAGDPAGVRHGQHHVLRRPAPADDQPADHEHHEAARSHHAVQPVHGSQGRPDDGRDRRGR